MFVLGVKTSRYLERVERLILPLFGKCHFLQPKFVGVFPENRLSELTKTPKRVGKTAEVVWEKDYGRF